MIEQVKRGEKISAKTYNKLVDAVNGNVPEGHYDNPNQNALQSKSSYMSLFQVKHGRGYRMESRPAQYGSYADSDVLSSNLWLYCGKDLSSMQKNVSDADAIFIINEDTPDLGGELLNSWFKVNGINKTYDGWIDLQYKNQTDEVHAAFADLYEKDEEDDEKYNLISSLFAISPKFDKDFIHNQLTSLIESYSPLDNKLSVVQINPIYTVTSLQNKGRYDIEGSSEIYQGYQMHTGALERLSSIDKDYVLYVDSELSDTNLCSIQWNSLSGKPFIEMFDFHTLSTRLSDLEHPFLYDVLLRKSDADGNVLKYVALSTMISVMTISGDADIEDWGLSSIQLCSDFDGQRLYQLYKFNDPDTDFTVGKEDLSSAEDSEYKVLIRDGKTKQLRYAALSGFGSGDGDKATGDSNLTAVGLSSVQRLSTENDGDYFQLYKFNSPDSNFALRYYDVANLTSEPQYKILVRDDGNKTLRYATLSGFDQLISGDADETGYWQSSTQLKKGYYCNYIQLYNFDTPDQNWGLDYTEFTDPNGDYKILARKKDGFSGNGSRLIYVTLSGLQHDLSGDSNYDETDHSISSYTRSDGKTAFQLYNFDKDTEDNVALKVASWDQYYNYGSKVLSVDAKDQNTRFVVRTTGTGFRDVDYRQLSIEVPPFVHGDADSYVRGTADSRTIVGYVHSFIEPEKNYYRLYNWDNSIAYQTVKSQMLSNDYVDIATGTKLDVGNHNYQFLVRDLDSGDLEYKQIAVKGDGGGGWDEGRITRIENKLGGVQSDITNIYGDITYLSGWVDYLSAGVGELSSDLSSLSSNCWIRGGDQNTCYGIAIGDSTNTAVVELDHKCLNGDWYVHRGDFSIDSGKTLKIGNTTLNESQLQQLLALIS